VPVLRVAAGVTVRACVRGAPRQHVGKLGVPVSDSERACCVSACVCEHGAHSVTEAQVRACVSFCFRAVLARAYTRVACVFASLHECMRACVQACVRVRARACLNGVCVLADGRACASAWLCMCTRLYTHTQACASIRRGGGGHARTITHTCRLKRTLKRKHTYAHALARTHTRAHEHTGLNTCGIVCVSERSHE
jgi:hypothetical protein